MDNINNVINVALIAEGALAARDNMNVVAIMTSQQTGPINSSNRYGLYSDSGSVATDFGTDSDVYDFAVALFGTSPNPTNAGGVLVVGYWRGTSETVAATAATLSGAQVNEVTVVSQLQGVTDGSMVVTIDGTPKTLSALDFSGATSFDEIATIIDTALGVTSNAEVIDNKLVITSATTGVLSTITVASAHTSGTFIGVILALATGTGAVLVQGAASEVLSAETQVAAITALKALVNFKGACFITGDTDLVIADLAAWAQANSVLMYDVFDSAANLVLNASTNVCWAIKLASQTNYRMLYSKAGNRKMAASYMARAHVVNFAAERSALTMHLKTLSVSAEEYTQSEITAAKAVGLDIYATIKQLPVILTSGANDFVDNRYNIIAFIDAVQTDMFNLLKQTGTKIAQTQRGVNQLIDQGEKTTRGFVRAEVFAPGTWSSPDYFGDRETFERSIEANGFYWMAGKLADQAQADRQARKSPVLQCAVKNAGAIHSAEIIINFNY